MKIHCIFIYLDKLRLDEWENWIKINIFKIIKRIILKRDLVYQIFRKGSKLYSS